jgi:Flp pilus assembly protein TadG
MKFILKPQKRQTCRERGVTLAFFAITGLSLLGMTALCLDISRFYLIGSELQNAVDAAALAAATELDGYASGITKATDTATQSMNKYNFGNTWVKVAREDVRYAANLTEFANGGKGYSEADAKTRAAKIRFVMVKLSPQRVGVYFANYFLNADHVDMTRTAIAGLSINGVAGDVGLTRLCNFVPLAVLQDPATGAPLNPNPECPDKSAFTAGCTYTIRGGSGNSVSAGNYQILAITGEKGGTDAKERMAGGISQCYRPGDYINTEPGVKTGPIAHGMNTRFGEYQGGGLDATTYPPDTNIMEGITYEQYRSGLPQYTKSPGPGGAPNRRIIILPIVEASEFSNGRSSVRINGFAPFFLRNKLNGSGYLVAEYINRPVIVGNASYVPSDINAGTGANPYLTTPVLYR